MDVRWHRPQRADIMTQHSDVGLRRLTAHSRHRKRRHGMDHATEGGIAIAIAVAMILIGMPRNGMQPRFMRGGVLGPLWALVAVVMSMIGIALIM